MSLRGTKQSLLYAITTVDCGSCSAGEVLFFCFLSGTLVYMTDYFEFVS